MQGGFILLVLYTLYFKDVSDIDLACFDNRLLSLQSKNGHFTNATGSEASHLKNPLFFEVFPKSLRQSLVKSDGTLNLQCLTLPTIKGLNTSLPQRPAGTLYSTAKGDVKLKYRIKMLTADGPACKRARH